MSKDGKDNLANNKKNSPINQLEVIKKISYYLDLKNRDKEFMSFLGYCNGFSLLYSRYSSENRTDYFFSSLRLIVEWDGNQKELMVSAPEFLSVAIN